ncbi:hypothetical protein MAPG_07733 [Magnaporthiopsis poae ATCC 64411]|uniref:Uncharacterized protein n=1 Tax=Magnaporthiopsis poae (strain ATCC 64411 / 73-15) TaxID=644358 RepID=A0A0C4E5G7_MAGP6|nr:hypothetical protein MAPG_07733 [Magnaporthiopsis poae ATCC 64411]
MRDDHMLRQGLRLLDFVRAAFSLWPRATSNPDSPAVAQVDPGVGGRHNRQPKPVEHKRAACVSLCLWRVRWPLHNPCNFLIHQPGDNNELQRTLI